jgi:uncharacterized repeat protein (TIGR03806 family)
LKWRSACALVVALFLACDSPDTEILPPRAETAKLSCRVPTRPPGRARAQNAFPRLAFEGPTRLVRTAEGASARWFVAERTGKILAFEDRQDAGASVFADLAAAGRIFEGSYDDGLMGLALHPRFADNGEVFVAYTGPSATSALEYHIDRARSTDGGRTLDLSTLEPMIVFPKVESIHHGGAMAFGPDGMLYIATGDGAFGDPDGNAQRLDSPMGKVLRIDVDAKRPYAVPPDNPFIAAGGARPEIWALGLRNPWTMSFDRASGALWLGDVGHRRWEEIDIITRGGNYGWRVKEGTQCFSTPTCRSEGFIDPVFTYSHGEGFSITAGFVYRGAAFPALREAFVFADFITGRVSAMREGKAETLIESGLNISGLAEDGAGEILVLDYLSGTIQRLAADDRPSEIAPKLSATGCFDTRGGRVADDLFPYDVVTPLWSDGAEKERWLKLPADDAIFVNKAGKWALPVGSVTFKTFRLDGKNVETRMFVHHEEGGWAGYSYAWDEDGMDATLLEDGVTRDLGGGRSWTYPSRGDCFACHNLATGRALGFTTSQMDRDGQIDALVAMGAIDPSRIVRSPAPTTIEQRARAYLDVNCGNCHRPTGPAAGLGDLRREGSLGEMFVCNVPATDSEGTRVRLRPGDPAASAIARRMRATDASRMPPIGSAVVDEAAASLIEAWIAAMDPTLCSTFEPTR